MSEPRRMTASDISEALWAEGRDYGVRIEADEQAALARWLAEKARVRNPRRRWPTAKDVADGWAVFGIYQRLPRGYGAAVHRRLRRLHP